MRNTWSIAVSLLLFFTSVYCNFYVYLLRQDVPKANSRYLDYSWVDFEVFRPAVATRCYGAHKKTRRSFLYFGARHSISCVRNPTKCYLVRTR